MQSVSPDSMVDSGLTSARQLTGSKLKVTTTESYNKTFLNADPMSETKKPNEEQRRDTIDLGIGTPPKEGGESANHKLKAILAKFRVHAEQCNFFNDIAVP